MYTRIFRPRLIFTIYAGVLAQVLVYSIIAHFVLDPKMFEGRKPPPMSQEEMAALFSGGGGQAPEMSFFQLENAAQSPEMRRYFEGKQVRMIGRFTGNERQFTLLRYKINCCAADATPLNAIITVDYSKIGDGKKESLPVNQLSGHWVSVVGHLAFQEQRPGYFVPVLVVTPTPKQPLKELVKVIPAPSNPYVY
jgi:hypothetical protein